MTGSEESRNQKIPPPNPGLDVGEETAACLPLPWRSRHSMHMRKMQLW